ncbi:DUF2157 domain-containing protein [Nocardia brasiliensis]|uniref:DUF2157 domain-containing protein n=1 Tax=Nocardia brasiliensis TaxID=37326 RepID=UPI0004A7758C|nr:DUF2157 domain-containing protein [Nocardia brasiliensis]
MARARQTALRRLVTDGVLTEAQYAAVVDALAAREQRPPGKVVAEIAAYIGAGLVFGGIALVIGSSWDDLARAGQVAVLFAVSLGLVLGAVAVVGGPAQMFGRAETGSRTRLASALLALAAGSVAGMVGTALDHSSADAGTWAVLAALLTAALGYIAVPAVLGMLACGVCSAAVVPGLLGDLAGATDTWVGFGLLAVAGIWFALTGFGAFVETWLGYVIAVAIALLGAVVVEADGRPWAFLLSVLVAGVCFGMFAQRRSTVLVVGGALAVALAAGQAVTELTDNPLAVAVTVLAIGALVLGGGAFLLVRSPKSEPPAS